MKPTQELWRERHIEINRRNASRSEPVSRWALSGSVGYDKKFMDDETSSEELTEEAKRQGAEAVAHVKGSAEAAANEALRIAEAAWYDVKTKTSDLQSACESYIVEKPGQSLLIALGIGFLIGLVLRR